MAQNARTLRKDYSYLYDKEFVVILPNNRIQGYIQGFDYDIGVTIVDANARDYYVLCTKGPSSRKWKSNHSIAWHNKIIAWLVKSIEAGVVDTSYVKNEDTGNASKISCPFSGGS